MTPNQGWRTHASNESTHQLVDNCFAWLRPSIKLHADFAFGFDFVAKFVSQLFTNHVHQNCYKNTNNDSD